MNLAELIRPFHAPTEYKDLLELILRAQYDRIELQELTKDINNIDKLDEYYNFVADLAGNIAYYSFDDIVLMAPLIPLAIRHTDIHSLSPDLKSEISSLLIEHRDTESLFVATTMLANNRFPVVVLSGIYKWQVEYHKIHKRICDLGEKAETYGTTDELYKLFWGKF